MTISDIILALFIETHYATLTKSQVDPGQPFRSEQRGKEGREQARKKKRLLFEWPRGLQGSTSKMMISNAKCKKKFHLDKMFYLFTEISQV